MMMIGNIILFAKKTLIWTKTFRVTRGPNFTSFYNPPHFENNPKCQTLKCDTISKTLYHRLGKQTVYLQLDDFTFF